MSILCARDPGGDYARDKGQQTPAWGRGEHALRSADVRHDIEGRVVEMSSELGKGTCGHVVGPGYRVAAEIVGISPASIRVRYAPPNGIERYDWFTLTPGKRYLRRHGDTSEAALRFEVGE